MSHQVVLETHPTYYLVNLVHLSCGLSCRDKKYFFFCGDIHVDFRKMVKYQIS